jgi:hypothetical protein
MRERNMRWRASVFVVGVLVSAGCDTNNSAGGDVRVIHIDLTGTWTYTVRHTNGVTVASGTYSLTQSESLVSGTGLDYRGIQSEISKTAVGSFFLFFESVNNRIVRDVSASIEGGTFSGASWYDGAGCTLRAVRE